MTDELSELDRDDLAKRAAKMAVLIKAPVRVNAICQHIVKHFQEKVEPNGFKAQVVTFDRECCVLYKKAMDELLVGPEASAIVMHTQGGKSDSMRNGSWPRTRRKNSSTVSAIRLTRSSS
jgi:type I restriction enzyme, R subunit